MSVRIVVVGRASRDPLIDAADAYLQKCRRHLRVSVEYVEAAKRTRSADDVRVRVAEAEAVSRAARGAFVVALDASGRQLGSEAFAKKLQGWMARDTVFVIGGATGLDGNFVKKSGFVLSLGAMTLPHRLARLVLSEQIFRAMAILHGEPYHK